MGLERRLDGVMQALIVKHQDRVAVDGIPDRTHTAGIRRLAQIDTVNLGGERWT